MAEAVAISRGLHFAIDSGLLPVVLESDAKGVVDLINSGRCIYTDIGIVITVIMNLSRQFTILISFFPRTANKAAYALAKLALLTVEDCFWLESYPPYLDFILLDDCSH
ncbi:hypothetical protein Ddye_009732 [Dipteronia dyeriana]|uniref:RNase H type-1 domain-containing protein n=1 Tax=Dipteronia dyeriana TaxID=168575 RepID=A0AAE0CMH4_9ROSI|nr:hypothetical protein Ddye_009732 [Dipteronia dyeriana]